MGSKDKNKDARPQLNNETNEAPAFSEKLQAQLKQVHAALLDSSPQSIEVRGAAKHLDAAMGALAQAGKFAEVKKGE